MLTIIYDEKLSVLRKLKMNNDIITKTTNENNIAAKCYVFGAINKLNLLIPAIIEALKSLVPKENHFTLIC